MTAMMTKIRTLTFSTPSTLIPRRNNPNQKNLVPLAHLSFLCTLFFFNKALLLLVGVPDRPVPPYLVNATDVSLKIAWDAPACNGAPILHYVLEMDVGVVAGANFNEIYKGSSCLASLCISLILLSA
jgi:hypothetical protein